MATPEDTGSDTHASASAVNHVHLTVLSRDREELKCEDLIIPRINLEVRWQIPPVLQEALVADLLQSIDTQVHQLFDDIFTEEKVRDNDRVSIRISFEGDSEPFFKMAKMSNDPVMHFFEGIARLLQSNRKLLLSQWAIQVTIFPATYGGTKSTSRSTASSSSNGRPPQSSCLSRRKRGTNPWSAAVIRNKKSTVMLQNTDERCFYRSLAVLVAFETYQQQRVDGDARQRRRALVVYRRIRDNIRDAQTVAAIRLQAAAGTKAPADEDDIVALAHHLSRNITIVNPLLPAPSIQFSTRDIHDYGVGTTLYVWQDGAHMHPITRINAFWGVGYYCKKCDVRSNGKYQHRCAGDTSCMLCRRDPEDHVDPLVDAETCQSCFRTFTDAKCMALHETVICKRSWMCTKCQRSYPHTRTQADHQCYEFKCSHCQIWVTNAHQCYIQPEQCKPHVTSLRFFDFESFVRDGTHVPNYAAVSSDGETVTEYFHNDGSSIIDEFLDGELLSDSHTDTTYLAHYARGYDAQFIQEALYKRGVRFEVIPNGHKIMQLTIPARKVRIIDSHNFIPQPLANFPKLFSLNGEKGFYPYRFNTPENFNYVGPMPPFSYFIPEGVDPESLEQKADHLLSGDDDETKLRAGLLKRHKWYKDRVAEGYEWNQLAETRRYGAMDAVLGAKGCLCFQQEFMELSCASKWSDDDSLMGVDPFAYVTIAAACMAAFKHKFLPAELIAYHRHSVDVHSFLSILWMEFVADRDDISIVHARNSAREERICGYKVDGFARQSNTVFEFNGCFFHGCRSCFPNRTSQYERQLQKEAIIKAAGYKVVSMWECAFRDVQYTPAYGSFMRGHPQLTEKLPLNVREAFFGGRTNAICLYYKCEQDTVIHYSDFTSLYPWVNARCLYGVGHPEILLHPSLDKLVRGEYFGVAKCRVLPPRDLYHPVLPVRIDQKLMFPLCHVCADTECVDCSHTDEERAFTGTWCTPELDQAVKEGYRILCVFEVHHFEKRVVGLFSEYVKTFLKGKQEASGWPKEGMSEEEKETYIAEYREHEGIQLERERIEKNPGRRQVSKLMVTSFWGKTAQRGNLPQVAVCLSSRTLRAVLFNNRFEVTACDPYPAHPSAWRVVYREVSHYLCVEPKNTNVYVAALTTCHARLRLYGELKKLGKRVLYCDTDSVIYTQKPDELSLELGPFLGDLTDELGEGKHIVEFVSTGPKSYSYMDNTGCSVIKFKGISKTLFNVQKINFQTMLQCVEDPKFMVHRDEGPMNMIFKPNVFGEVRTVYQYKVFRMVYRKRMIDRATLMTYPWGFKA